MIGKYLRTETDVGLCDKTSETFHDFTVCIIFFELKLKFVVHIGNGQIKGVCIRCKRNSGVAGNSFAEINLTACQPFYGKRKGRRMISAFTANVRGTCNAFFCRVGNFLPEQLFGFTASFGRDQGISEKP